MISLVLGTSCGLKGPISPTSSVNSLSLLELQCSEDQTYKETEASEAANKMAREVDSFLKAYNNDPDREGAVIFRVILGGSAQSTTPSDPMVISDTEIKSQLSDIESQWIKAVGEGNWFRFLANDKSDFQFQEEVNTDQITDVLKKLNQVIDLSSRWNYLQCNLAELSQREKKDIRAYLRYKDFQEKSCSGHCDESELLKNKNAQEELIHLCQAINSEYICQLEYEQRKKSKSLTEFESFYLQKNNEIYNNFFKIDVLNKWNCQKNGEKTIIEVPYYVDEIFKVKISRSIDEFEAFVEQKWSSDYIQLKLILTELPTKDVVKINWVDSSVSFVNYSQPKVINMSKQLTYKRLMLVFAHEIGHVLGFPDCYLEFYDQDKKEAIYYDLDFDSDNLMCDIHFGAQAPDDYLDQLAKSACKN